MPRTKRDRSSKTHHILLQGYRKLPLFPRPQDKQQFLLCLKKCKERSDIRLFSYVVLSTHAHIVLEEAGQDTVSDFMRRLTVMYAHWYRKEHQIAGSTRIFRGRYASQTVQSESRLLALCAYLAGEPVRLHCVHLAEAYPYSSLREKYSLHPMVDTTVYYALSLPYAQKGAEEKEEGVLLEETPDRFGYTDEEVRQLVQAWWQKKAAGAAVSDPESREEQKELIRKLRFGYGISIRQIERVTGICRGTVQRVRREN